MATQIVAGRSPYPFRTHQERALDALREAFAGGQHRAWVVLPPGAGKTLVGLEASRRLAEAGEVRQVVAFGPNTAIQGQWAAEWDSFVPDGSRGPASSAGTDRSLDMFFTALTYQSLAVFDAEQDPEQEADGSLLARLHPNGRALVEQIKEAGPIAIVLDECHHLLEVWGRLLGELLEALPEARVIGLTATPPATLTAAETELVDELFGEVVMAASIPAVVREGDLAPFAELVWLTRPTAGEADWMSGQAERFTELSGALTDPEFGSLPFLQWLDQRFVVPVGTTVRWERLVADEPELTDAALRMHHVGLLALPEGARPTEAHRVEPTADDWMLLVADWVKGHLQKSGAEEDERVAEAIRRALPSVGYQWTRHGIRRGRSPVDRVLARSAAKTTAVVDIVRREHLNLAARMRMLVLCDYEFATATLPADLSGVISVQAGSATLALQTLVASAEGPDLAPVLVTARTVAGAPGTLGRLIAHVATTDPVRAAGLRVTDADGGVSRIDGPWSSRAWVGHVTRFFESGGCRVLVGTRGLLGEGWDARRITGLVDLTAATTPTAVTQTRGRALRTDPDWPQKVALNWSVVCVATGQPRGDSDWQRLVRKHTGFFGVDESGDVVDGVGHIDPAFSPYAPPATGEFDAINARMVVRSEARSEVADRWQVGEPYTDTVARTLRVRGGPSGGAPARARPGVVLRGEGCPRPGAGRAGDRRSCRCVGAGRSAAAASARAAAPVPVPGSHLWRGPGAPVAPDRGRPA